VWIRKFGANEQLEVVIVLDGFISKEDLRDTVLIVGLFHEK
jgi:hypothetical protein